MVSLPWKHRRTDRRSNLRPSRFLRLPVSKGYILHCPTRLSLLKATQRHTQTESRQTAASGRGWEKQCEGIPWQFCILMGAWTHTQDTPTGLHTSTPTPRKCHAKMKKLSKVCSLTMSHQSQFLNLILYYSYIITRHHWWNMGEGFTGLCVLFICNLVYNYSTKKGF